MIFDAPPPDAPVDQGDIIDGCPLHHLESFDLTSLLAERELESVVIHVQPSPCPHPNLRLGSEEEFRRLGRRSSRSSGHGGARHSQGSRRARFNPQRPSLRLVLPAQLRAGRLTGISG